MEESITLQSVAKEAGVSVTTVHRVLRNKHDVSPRTSKLVKNVAKQLGYQLKGENVNTNGVSQGILLNSDQPLFTTFVIGLLLIERPLHLLKRTINAHLLSYIEAALAKYELLMTVIQVADPENLPATVSRNRLDGVIILGEPSARVMRDRLHSMNPVGVFSSVHSEERWADWITSDYHSRGQLAANYLADRGHRRVGFVNTEPGHGGFEQVGYSFLSSARHRGISARIFAGGEGVRMHESSDQTAAIADRVIGELAAQDPSQRPTGIHIPNDDLAVEIYASLRKYGIEPMRDIDIITCDNDEFFLSQLNPKPATMDLNLEVMADRIVEKLIYRIKNPESFTGVRVLVPPTLVPAETCFRS